MSSRLRRPRGVRGWLAILVWPAVLLAWFVVLRPQTLGGPVDYLVIRGDSMLPTYETGDLVIVRSEPTYQPGEIVAYRVPDGELGAGRIVIHRLVSGDPTRGFVVEGDNNPAPDPWHPAAGDIVGRAWIAVPTVGRILATLHQPAMLAALAVAAFATMSVWGEIARRRPRPATPSQVEVAPGGP